MMPPVPPAAPVPVPPSIPPATQGSDTVSVITEEELSPIETPTSPEPVSLDDMMMAPGVSMDNTPEGQDTLPESTASPAASPATNDDIWERFNAIVAEEKTKPRADDPLSHLERVGQLDTAIEQAGDTVEISEDKKITEDYDKVFGGDAHTSRFQVPGIIKTYEPAQSIIDKEEKEKAAHLAERLDTYKKYFDAAEQYLTRAYASGNADIMTSARTQFQSLQDRYPEYVQHRSGHIADMQKIIDTHTQQHLESVAHESFQIDENTIVAPGMRVTGGAEAYVITSIVQATPDHEAMIIFTADHTKAIYQVPASALTAALTDADLDTDEFFQKYTKA